MTLIIPSIDISRGLAVKRVQGVEGTEIVRIDPMKILEDIIKYVGKIRRIHIVDLDGAKEGKPMNRDIIIKLVREAVKNGLEVEVGGGIRDLEHALTYVREGADIVLGSLIFKNPDKARTIIKEVGTDRVFVSVDIKHGRIAVSGWTETVDVDPIDVLSSSDIMNVIYTCIDVEGRMTGPTVDRSLVRSLRERLNLRNLFYAGGVRNRDDVEMLEREGFNGVIIGMAMYVKGLSHFVEHV
ncbi:MAG: nickel transporter [Crenarchaeota archaeon]|nr:nickel transporter [Thermoproteota archaeon]